MVDADEPRQLVRDFLAEHDPSTMDRLAFLRARYDAGLAWVSFPAGLGGLGAPRSSQPVVDGEFAAAGAPDNNPLRIGIGLGMAAPTILRHGTDEQRQRFLRPLWTGEEVWCQLFSEPGAGSDLAALGTRAVLDAGSGPQDEAARAGLGAGDGWIVNGQKVWTSMAHEARFAILIARTDPDVPKHDGITYFVCDMTAPGVEVRPLRQITGEAEFNEVFLTDVRIPDSYRLGAVGDGWRVARTTLMNERVAIGGGAAPREAGMIGVVAREWRERPELRTPGQHDALMRLWVAAEAARLAAERLREQLAAGQPGAEGSAVKLAYARLNAEISGFELELLGEDGLSYDDYTMRRPSIVDWKERSPGYRYLRAKGNSIEGGTSEVLLNIIAERVLGLPSEPRMDKDMAWKDLPR
ncbi:MAG: acyl-CoA dehydrogenase [Actinobacteria bacterium 13_2_20CM_2_71_6]|nr:MAG: acyl-CoA dehydrogenase [Actinobacteria bacterium 13_2_20CM_2_71_6]